MALLRRNETHIRSLGDMQSQHFEIPTRDGRTRLTGQVDLPTAVATRYPAVLMAPGGWFMDRDGYMGGSGTERDLVYRDLAKDLGAAGMAVVRYDNRGVRCNEMTMPPCPEGSTELEVTKHYLHACVDPEVRQTVSVQTQLDDLEDVWAFVVNHVSIDRKRTIIWAHSEGGLNAARLIGDRRIRPLGIIFVGTATETPMGLLRWQVVDRYAEQVMNWDADGDGRVTEADVERQFQTDALFNSVGTSRDVLIPPAEGWTLESIRARFAREYEAMKAAALARPDDAPYPDQTAGFPMVAASNHWWRQWFEDTTPIIDHLAGYLGRAVFHIGGLDTQSPGERQYAFAQSRIQAGIFARAPRLVFHKSRGHSLRTGEPTAGPMDEDVNADMVKEIVEILHAE
jgi:pimeloyl-ACP methyl ester carboxylesterase